MSTLQIFPSPGVEPSDPETWPGRHRGWGRWGGWMTPEVAKSLPGIARGINLIGGQVQQMPMDDYRGVHPLPRPRLLDQPDPDESRAWFVGVHVEDYLLNGNAVHYVTARDAAGWPMFVSWVPAAWVTLTVAPGSRQARYWVGGVELARENVVHVKRGADRLNPARGVGVVEQHLDALGTVRDQHRYESDVLEGAAVPSVAVIAPDPRVSQDEADDAQERWIEKYGTPGRKPAILPAGTQVIPLAWSPSDSQLVEARQLSLVDQANMLNLDAFHVGAPGSSHTYKSPGPLYLAMLRETIAPILSVFEDVWSAAWLPAGRRVVFDRSTILRDDMQTMVATAASAVAAGLWSVEEARVYLGMAPEFPDGQGPQSGVTTTSPIATVPADTPDDSPADSAPTATH